MDCGPEKRQRVEGAVSHGLRPLPLECFSPLPRSCLFSVLVVFVLQWTLPCACSSQHGIILLIFLFISGTAPAPSVDLLA